MIPVAALPGSTFGGGSATTVATTTVDGNLTLQAGSVYAVTANATAVSSANVTGAARIDGSGLRVATTTSQLPFGQLQILAAAGGLTGTFATVTSSAANVTPFVTYGPNAATVTLDRTDVNFAVPGESVN